MATGNKNLGYIGRGICEWFDNFYAKPIRADLQRKGRSPTTAIVMAQMVK